MAKRFRKLRLQELMDERGLTIEQVSADTGIPVRKLQHVIDQNLRCVYIDTIADLIHYFGCSPEELIYEEERPE